jgi:hypothetical protein
LAMRSARAALVGSSGPVAEWTRIRAMSFVLRLVVTA